MLFYYLSSLIMKKVLLILLSLILVSSCSLSEKELKTDIKEVRDDARILDLKLIQSSLEQVYQDTMEYPKSLDSITIYLIDGIPVDKNQGQTINGCTFWYNYESFEKDWLPNNWYRLSTCLESDIKQELLKNDNWIYDNKYEIWVW